MFIHLAHSKRHSRRRWALNQKIHNGRKSLKRDKEMKTWHTLDVIIPFINILLSLKDSLEWTHSTPCKRSRSEQNTNLWWAWLAGWKNWNWRSCQLERIPPDQVVDEHITNRTARPPCAGSNEQNWKEKDHGHQLKTSDRGQKSDNLWEENDFSNNRKQRETRHTHCTGSKHRMYWSMNDE